MSVKQVKATFNTRIVEIKSINNIYTIYQPSHKILIGICSLTKGRFEKMLCLYSHLLFIPGHLAKPTYFLLLSLPAYNSCILNFRPKKKKFIKHYKSKLVCQLLFINPNFLEIQISETFVYFGVIHQYIIVFEVIFKMSGLNTL